MIANWKHSEYVTGIYSTFCGMLTFYGTLSRITAWPASLLVCLLPHLWQTYVGKNASDFVQNTLSPLKRWKTRSTWRRPCRSWLQRGSDPIVSAATESIWERWIITSEVDFERSNSHIDPSLCDELTTPFQMQVNTRKTLGVEWNSRHDHFRLVITELPEQKELTKQSDIAKVFDF